MASKTVTRSISRRDLLAANSLMMNFFFVFTWKAKITKSGRILCSFYIFFPKSVRQIVARKPAQQLIFNFDVKEPIASSDIDRSRAVKSLFLIFPIPSPSFSIITPFLKIYDIQTFTLHYIQILLIQCMHWYKNYKLHNTTLNQHWLRFWGLKHIFWELTFIFFFISFQERGVGAFPPNFVVTTMMDVAAVRAHDKNPIMCSSCEDKLPAAARCIECMDFLCHDCRNAHMRLRLTKTHRVRFKSLSYKIHYDEERKRGQGSLASHGRIFLIYKVYITLHRPMKVPPPPPFPHPLFMDISF